MEGFKNPKAIELLNRAREMEDYAHRGANIDSMIENQFKGLMEEAKRTRELAIAIENGLIFEDELKDV